MLGEDCLAFDQDLSGLPSDKLEEYLAFENAYVRFYRLWTGSFSLPLGVSRALDRVQSAIEGLRSELSSTLEPPTRAVDFEKVDS